jgi:hypothetical protein
MVSSRRRPFVITMVALAGTAKLACGSSTDDDDPCAGAKPGDTCSEAGHACSIPVVCGSGEAAVSISCDNGHWTHTPTACAHQGDECQPRYRCESGSWQFLGYGGNPPAPCPKAPPADGTTCNPGAGFGADPSTCGYPCEDGAGWSVVSCGAAGTTGTWSAGTCDPNG